MPNLYYCFQGCINISKNLWTIFIVWIIRKWFDYFCFSSGPGTLKRQFVTVGGPVQFSFPRFQNPTLSSYQASDIDAKFEQYFGSNHYILEEQRKLIQWQTEVLQEQLQLLRKPNAERSAEMDITAPADKKGKWLASSSSSSSNSDRENCESM